MFKHLIASDIPAHRQFVRSQELKIQEFLAQIDQWGKNGTKQKQDKANAYKFDLPTPIYLES